MPTLQDQLDDVNGVQSSRLSARSTLASQLSSYLTTLDNNLNYTISNYSGTDSENMLKKRKEMLEEYRE
jgi:hypothetical protein